MNKTTQSRLGQKAPSARDTLAAMRGQAARQQEISTAPMDGPSRDAEGAEDGLPAEFSFRFRHRDQRGRLWEGDFEAHVLTIREHIEHGALWSQLLHGVPPERVSAQAVTLADMVAWLTLAITRCPKWADDLLALRDLSVISALYGEVASYEARFWGTDRGDGGGGDAPNPEGARRDPDVPSDGDAPEGAPRL